MPRSILKGAVIGLVYWLVFGTVETVLSVGIQLFQNPEMAVMGWQWRLIAVVFSVYALMGLVLGALAGMMLAWANAGKMPGSHQTAAALTLVVAYVANLIYGWPLARSEQVALTIAILLGISLALFFVASWRKLLQPLTGPFAVSLLLLGIPWLSREVLGSERASWLRLAVSLLFPALVVWICVLKFRWQQERAPGILRHVATAGVLLGAFLAYATAASRSNIRAENSAGVNSGKEPNILLVTMDTVRADHTSLYGYERDTTPRLREFARSATLYARAIATSDYTFPTHASMFSGLYPDWQGAVWSDVLPDGIPTLAEVLRSNGYWTSECVANYGLLGPQSGLTKGFASGEWRRAVTLDTEGTVIPVRRHPYYLRESAVRALGALMNTDYFFRTTLSAADINRCAAAMLDRARNTSAPFFLFVNYMDAHAGYVSDAPYCDLFTDGGRRLPVSVYRRLKEQVNSGKRKLDSWEKSYLISQYDGGIAAIDSAMGELLDRLQQSGSLENTLVIITSDHGEEFGERGLLEHKIDRVDQALIGVPLLIKYPAQRDGRKYGALVSQIDLMPTVLDLTGIAARSPMEGRSLFSNEVQPLRGIVSETAGYGTRRAIISGSMKLVVSKKGSPELYDLASDPNEEHNLYSAQESRAVELAHQLEGWVAGRPHRKAQPQKLDPAAAERLKSLGYVQ
jgi:arylsulfatase A-like enzyme